jgi:hypothetical protein
MMHTRHASHIHICIIIHICSWLSLRWNKIGSAGCRGVAKVISDGKNNVMRHLDISYNEIGYVYVCKSVRTRLSVSGHVCECMCVCVLYIYIYIYIYLHIYSHICLLVYREDACMDLARAIQASPSLRELCLSGNTIGEKGALCILSGIMGESALARLEMKVCVCVCVHSNMYMHTYTCMHVVGKYAG